MDHLQKRSPINDDILWYSMIFDMLPYFPKNSYDTPWFTFIADSVSWTLSVFSKSNIDFVGVNHHFVEFWDIFWPQLAMIWTNQPRRLWSWRLSPIQLIANMSGIDMYAVLVYHTTWASHIIIPCALNKKGVRIFSVTIFHHNATLSELSYFTLLYKTSSVKHCI